MFSLEITVLGLALAIDAAVVSFTMGILSLKLTKKEKIVRGLIITLTFALFQFLMVWGGSLGGYLFTFSSYGHYSQLLVAMIFIILSFKFFQEGTKLGDREYQEGFWPLIILAVATSIDALAAGVSLATYPHAERAALEVGLVTFIMCGSFFGLSQFLYRIPEKWLMYLGGAIFFILSIRIILPYLPKGLV
jgi:putative Mn2+ efflux pump MntP